MDAFDAFFAGWVTFAVAFFVGLVTFCESEGFVLRVVFFEDVFFGIAPRVELLIAVCICCGFFAGGMEFCVSEPLLTFIDAFCAPDAELASGRGCVRFSLVEVSGKAGRLGAT